MPLEVPGPSEWDTTRLSLKRRGYLESETPFEQMVADLTEKAEVLCVNLEPSDGLKGKGSRRAVFRIAIGAVAVDLLHNSPHGLRGRYWQAPDLGDVATRRLLDALRSTVLSFAARNLSSREEIELSEKSIDAPTAKVWISEDNFLSSIDDQQLCVRRWCKNEENAPERIRGLWRRWWPDRSEIEIKGRFLFASGAPYDPPSKRFRASHIHFFGFT
jgi:hypothetical protein